MYAIPTITTMLAEFVIGYKHVELIEYTCTLIMSGR